MPPRRWCARARELAGPLLRALPPGQEGAGLSAVGGGGHLLLEVLVERVDLQVALGQESLGPRSLACAPIVFPPASASRRIATISSSLERFFFV